MAPHTIALYSADEASLRAASELLLALAAKEDTAIALLQGVTTAQEARAIYSAGGEVWRLGEDDGVIYPHLSAVTDRTIDNSDPAMLQAGIVSAWHELTRKVRVAA